MDKFLLSLLGGLIIFMLAGQTWAFIVFFGLIIISSFVANKPK